MVAGGWQKAHLLALATAVPFVAAARAAQQAVRLAAVHCSGTGRRCQAQDGATGGYWRGDHTPHSCCCMLRAGRGGRGSSDLHAGGLNAHPPLDWLTVTPGGLQGCPSKQRQEGSTLRQTGLLTCSFAAMGKHFPNCTVVLWAAGPSTSTGPPGACSAEECLFQSSALAGTPHAMDIHRVTATQACLQIGLTRQSNHTYQLLVSSLPMQCLHPGVVAALCITKCVGRVAHVEVWSCKPSGRCRVRLTFGLHLSSTHAQGRSSFFLSW